MGRTIEHLVSDNTCKMPHFLLSYSWLRLKFSRDEYASGLNLASYMLKFTKKMYCHLLGFSLTLTASASQDAGANCFCSRIKGKNNKQTTSEEQMKFNKWTLGLAAVGAVSLASAVRADEAPKMSQMQTALSNTTISGYVDVAAQYNINHDRPKAPSLRSRAHQTASV